MATWRDMDKVWEQEKLGVWKMLENNAESLTSGASFVGLFIAFEISSVRLHLLPLLFFLLCYYMNDHLKLMRLTQK